jgi:hypothetical protein
MQHVSKKQLLADQAHDCYRHYKLADGMPLCYVIFQAVACV